MSWERFKTRLIDFGRSLPTWEEYQKSRQYFDDKIDEERETLISSYLRGTEDEIEKRLRIEQIRILDLNHVKFANHITIIESRISQADELDREWIIKKIEEEDIKREELKRLREEEEPSNENDFSSPPAKKKKPEQKSSKEKLAIRLKTGLISEKGLAFSLYDSAIHPDKTIDMDYRTWWIGDCISWAIIEDYGMPWTEEEKKDFFMNPEELKKAEEYLLKLREDNPQVYTERVPQVVLLSSQIREKIGKRKLLNSNIHELVKKFVGVPIERKTKRKIGKDGDTWVRFGEIDNICKVQYIETGKLSQRNRHPEYCYKFIFDRATSLDFWNSLRLGFFDCRPPSYYSLKGGSQLLLRAIGWTANPTDIELRQACRITGIQSNHKTIQKKSIEGYLDELREGGFISGWKKRAKKSPGTRRNEVWYKVLKARHLPYN